MRGLSPIVAVMLAVLIAAGAAAVEISRDDAAAAAAEWLSMTGGPLGEGLGNVISGVEPVTDQEGGTVYYIVRLLPSGIVIVSADTAVEPVIAFSSESGFAPSLGGPLAALLSEDIPGRMSITNAAKPSFQVTQSVNSSHDKWARLLSVSGKPNSKADSVDDQRVAPFIQSTWGQALVDSAACYNYYTPPGAAGTLTNYPSGCIATAMAQIMRHFEYPTSSVGTSSFSITVDSVVETRTLRGGDGTGSAYSWDDMPLTPDSSISDDQRKAIGTLLYDAGISVNTIYSADVSAATTSSAVSALVGTFGYNNAIEGFNNGQDIGDSLDDMLNPNLDAGHPAMIGISASGETIGHAALVDGYGYVSSTLYHHLNLGWDGTGDAWYALPNLETDIGTFTSVDSTVYNLFKTGSGEIISGRVTDTSGNPVSGVTVTAVFGDSSTAATTNSDGIYAVLNLSSGTSYTMSASRDGYYFADQTVTTGTSASGTSTCGNKWGIDFVNEPSLGLPIPKVNDFIVGAGDGYIDVEWIYPTPSEAYEGVIIAYGTSVFPTLKETEDADGNKSLAVSNGHTVYSGKTDTQAIIPLSNGTTAYFCVWAYRGTDYGSENNASSTPASGGDGINDTETLYGGTHVGGGGGCFLETAR